MSERVFGRAHAIQDELAWLDAEGPTSPAMVSYIRGHEHEFDFFVFFSVRYYHAYHGARAVPAKAVLVPTAERDGALGLAIFPPVFRGVRAFMYNSPEERALIQALAGNHHVPGVVVGVGSDIPPHTSATRFRYKHGLADRFAVYIGRVDENKGCAELFDYFQRYSRMLADSLHLVLIGSPVIPIPDHPRIHHLGFVSDQDKFDALAASEFLIMPSYLESLSMVALEAWALGRPVLANGRCDVLRGQCIRSNGGLYYTTFPEFVETVRALDGSPSLAAALGRNGRAYFARHYAWPVIERKYLDMFGALARGTPLVMEPMPGWWARRRPVLPPANEVIARLPTGPALDLASRAEEPAALTSHAASPSRSAPGGATGRGESRAAAAAVSAALRQESRPRAPQAGQPAGPGAAGRARGTAVHPRRGFRHGPGRHRRAPGGRPPRRPGDR
jgi:hypothetical protein